MKHLRVCERNSELLLEFANSRITRGFNRGLGDGAAVLCQEYVHFLEQNKCDNVLLSTTKEYWMFFDYLKARVKFHGVGFLRKSTIQHFRYAIHSFYSFLFDAGYLSSMPITRQLFFHTKAIRKRVLSEKQIKFLFKSCNSPIERAVLALAYGCGMRRSEMSRLLICDYKPLESVVIVRAGKFFKSRIIPVAKSMNSHLRDYIETLCMNPLPHVNGKSSFLCIDNIPLNGQDIYLILQKIVARTAKGCIRKIKVTLHELRNSVAVHMLNRGADFDFVRRFLGHSLIDTTMLYAKRRRARISIRRRIQRFQDTAV